MTDDIASSGTQVDTPVEGPAEATGAAAGAEGDGAAAGVTITSFDDPILRPYAKNPKRAEAVVAAFLLLGLAGFAFYGGLYWVGGQPQWEGIFMGVGLFAFGFGLSAWGKYLLPQGPFVEERHPLVGSPAEQAGLRDAVVDRGVMVMRRRGLLGLLLGAGAAVMGVVLGFPLLRSLGPPPKKTFDVTNWKADARLVDLDGRPIHVTDLEVGGALTVFPEGFAGSPVDQTMLVRAEPAGVGFTTLPGREGWTPDGYVAYSKLCTHAGCPVGLYEELSQQLLCPCHQSLFEVKTGANPVFGPAPRPLPQLALKVDSKGFLRAQHGYTEPVGPGFWER
ncbi:MAG TPA: Rieske 2Fe-2S domain-containing protein [Acidimicrobiales bacterium]|nr:Rieske 2Fe-2S domain-containing protein [Acidimicrobiales bacterium]